MLNHPQHTHIPYLRQELKAVMPNLPVGIRHFDGTFVTDADHKALSAGAGATVGPTWSRCVIRQDPATYKGAADLLAEWVANQEEDEDEEQEVEASVEPEPEAAAQAAKDTKQVCLCACVLVHVCMKRVCVSQEHIVRHSCLAA